MILTRRYLYLQPNYTILWCEIRCDIRKEAFGSASKLLINMNAQYKTRTCDLSRVKRMLYQLS